uniref:Ig-like domain-containing protein n=1 Tax=Phocoena sinus TaxID=42100 RepID=A0A8C9CCQ3_PHOSS
MEKLLTVSLVTLWLQLASERENLQALSIQEGENATMNCSYKTDIDTLHWYRQDSRRGFAHLILIRSNEREKRSGRLRVTFDNSIKGSSLSITASQAADPATYLCAMDTQYSPGNCSPNANPARAASYKPQQCAELVVMSSHKGESTNSWQQEREACQIPDVFGSMLD